MPSHPNRRRRVYRDRVAAGVCVKGCGNKARDDRVMCGECAAKLKAYFKRWWYRDRGPGGAG